MNLDTNLTADLERLKEEYREARNNPLLTQRQLAALEHRVWTLFCIAIPGNKGDRRDWLHNTFGGQIYEYEARGVLWNGLPGSEPFWERIEKGMTIGTAMRLYRASKKEAAIKNVTVPEAANKILAEYDEKGHLTVTADGKQIRKVAPYKKHYEEKLISSVDMTPTDTKEFKKFLDVILGKYASAQAPSGDPFLVKDATEELIHWVHDGVDAFNRRISKIKSDEKEEQAAKIGRSRFFDAIDILALKRTDFTFGRPIPLRIAKRAHIQRARQLHPDANKGSDATVREYHAVNEAYKLLEEHANQFGDTTAKQARR